MAYHVMIVDDEPVIRDGIRMRLEALDPADFPVQIVGMYGNGRDALESLRTHAVDIAFCDIRMPLMDGVAFMNAVNDEKLFAQVIVISGYAEFEYVREALRTGAVDYLLKPIDPQAFQRAVLAAMRAVDESDAKVLSGASDANERFIRHAILSALRRLSTREPEFIVRELPELLGRLFLSRAARTMSEVSLTETAKEALAILRDIAAAILDAAPAIHFPDEIRDAQAAHDLLAAYVRLCAERGVHNGVIVRSSISGVLSYIEKMQNENLSLDDIARSFGYHPVHLSRMIKGYTGMGFSQYLNKVRMSRAKQLLQSSDMSITDISMAVGFNDLAYFCRVFKKALGVTPQEFRKHI